MSSKPRKPATNSSVENHKVNFAEAQRDAVDEEIEDDDFVDEDPVDYNR